MEWSFKIYYPNQDFGYYFDKFGPYTSEEEALKGMKRVQKKAISLRDSILRSYIAPTCSMEEEECITEWRD